MQGLTPNSLGFSTFKVTVRQAAGVKREPWQAIKVFASGEQSAWLTIKRFADHLPWYDEHLFVFAADCRTTSCSPQFGKTMRKPVRGEHSFKSDACGHPLRINLGFMSGPEWKAKWRHAWRSITSSIGRGSGVSCGISDPTSKTCTSKRPLLRRIDGARKINNVPDLVLAVDAGGCQNLSRGFVLHRTWEWPQAMCTRKNHEGYALIISAIARDPNGSILSCVVYGTCPY